MLFSWSDCPPPPPFPPLIWWYHGSTGVFLFRCFMSFAIILPISLDNIFSFIHFLKCEWSSASRKNVDLFELGKLFFFFSVKKKRKKDFMTVLTFDYVVCLSWVPELSILYKTELCYLFLSIITSWIGFHPVIFSCNERLQECRRTNRGYQSLLFICFCIDWDRQTVLCTN